MAVKKIDEARNSLVVTKPINLPKEEDLEYQHPILFVYVVNNNLKSESFKQYFEIYKTFVDRWFKSMNVSFHVVRYNRSDPRF